MSIRRTPGERAGLKRQEILRAALRLVDAEGLSALTMRRLATQLGVEAMTLYHHISNKDELLDGLVELVVTQVRNVPWSQDWQQLLLASAIALRDALSRHPNVMSLVISRPAVTMGNLDLIEELVSRLNREGFNVTRALTIVYSIVDMTISYCLRVAAVSNRNNVLSQIDAERHPLLAHAAADSDTDAFETTVTALVAGFARQLD